MRKYADMCRKSGKTQKGTERRKKIFMHHDFKTKLIMDLTGGD